MEKKQILNAQIALKTTEKLKHDFDEIIDRIKTSHGLSTNNEALEQIIKEFSKTELASQLSYGAQLVELNQLTFRISEVFVNLAKQNETDKTFTQRQHDEEINKLNEKLTTSSETILKLNEEKQEQLMLIEENKLKLEEIEGLNKQLFKDKEDLTNDKEELVADKKMLQDSISLKDGLIADKISEINDMKRDISKNKELIDTVSNLNKKIDLKDQELLKQKQNHEISLNELNFNCEKALFQKEKELQDKFNYDIEQIRVQRDKLVTEHNQRFSELQIKYTSILEDKQKIELQNKSLLDEIATLKKQLEENKVDNDNK